MICHKNGQNQITCKIDAMISLYLKKRKHSGKCYKSRNRFSCSSEDLWQDHSLKNRFLLKKINEFLTSCCRQQSFTVASKVSVSLVDPSGFIPLQVEHPASFPSSSPAALLSSGRTSNCCCIVYGHTVTDWSCNTKQNCFFSLHRAAYKSKMGLFLYLH